MDDEDSERVWHGNGSVDPVIDAQNVPVNNSSDITVTSQYTDKKFFILSRLLLARRSRKRALSSKDPQLL